jgi:hypothetical protein
VTRTPWLRLIIFALLGVASVAPLTRCQAQAPKNEFGVWGAYSFNSPDVYGSRGHQEFGVAAFRYGRALISTRSFAVEYTLDVEPVEIMRQSKYVSCQIQSQGISHLTYCPQGHETVYGGGVSPFGWKFNFLRSRRWQPIGAFSGGFISSVRPIPLDVPRATAFNFTFDFQVGVERFNSARTGAWTFAYKLQHISNAGLSAVNPGVDLNVLSVGYSFFK